MRYFLLSIILGGCTQLYAQSPFNMEVYLSSALKDQSLERYQSQLDFLDENNYNAPWISRLEFRVGNEDVDASVNEYRLRLSPTTPAEIKANKRYYEHQVNMLNSQQQFAINNALFTRYMLIIELNYLLERKQLLQEQIQFQNLFINRLSSRGSENLNLKDLVSVQNEQSKTLFKLEEIETSIAEVLFYIGLDYKSASTDFAPIKEIIEIPQIKSYLEIANSQTEKQNLQTELIKSELELSRLEWNVDKAKSRSNIGYIQSNLDTDKGDVIGDKVSFQVGVRIPIVNPSKPSLNRKAVELLEDEAKAESKITQLQQEQELNTMLFLRLLNKYQVVLDRITLAESLVTSPLSQMEWSQIVALKSYQLQLLEEKLQTEKQIREEYIDYVNSTSGLLGSPILNYLSSSLNPVTE